MTIWTPNLRSSAAAQGRPKREEVRFNIAILWSVWQFFSDTFVQEISFGKQLCFYEFQRWHIRSGVFFSSLMFNISRSSSSHSRWCEAVDEDFLSFRLRPFSVLFVRLCLPRLLSLTSPRNSFPHCADNNLHKTPRRKHTVLDPRLQHPLHSKASPPFQGLSVTEIERDYRPLCWSIGFHSPLFRLVLTREGGWNITCCRQRFN